jgi:beta-N-acetylhexosaminidase
MKGIRTISLVAASILCLTATQLLAIDRDSLDIKIGQMILIGYPGTEVDSATLDAIRSGKAGSIIMFEKNVPKTTNAFAPLKKVIWTYQKAAPIPLLVCIDQEGGKVNRLKEKYGFPRSITADAIGKSKSLDSVSFYAESIASNLAGLGFNVNFAPTVDVAVELDNPAIVKPGRSFSSNPDSVTLFAREYIKAHHKFGIITALKHFPGHGSSKDDTHLGIADVTRSWQSYELDPYRTLLKEGYVDAVMSSHIVNKKLDPSGRPGTLSKRILDSLLRKNIGFQGVVFSDDMHMHAITKHFPLEEAIRLAIDGGIDVLCFSGNIPGSDERTVDKVHGIIRKLVSTGALTPARIDASYRRVMELKKRIGSTESVYYQAMLATERTNNEVLRKKLAETEKTLAESQNSGKKKKKRKKS